MAEHYLSLGRQSAEAELVQRLIASGVDPRTVESTTGISPSVINQVLTVHFHGKIRVPEDDELIAQARQLAKKVMAKASFLLDRAPLPIQINIMKSVMPAVGRMIGNDQGASHEDAFHALTELLGSQRVDPHPLAALSLARESPPPTLPTDDSDQGINP